uniref:Integrase catalytic domain-containing protein n=1 Tax=Nothobranchius furzeri TaxID=105023 RepID=A0A8C6L6M4_NOTFU
MFYFPGALDGHLYYKSQSKFRLVVFQSQICDVLRSCHDDFGSGGHPGRRRTLEKVSSSYHWKTLFKDVNKWVTQHDTLKTVAPVLHPIQVQGAWSVLGIDLIGPLPTTNMKFMQYKFILTATDLFTKWVVAKSLYTKTATEVSKEIVNILLDFGLVERIITDQGWEFVNEVQLCTLKLKNVIDCIFLTEINQVHTLLCYVWKTTSHTWCDKHHPRRGG